MKVESDYRERLLITETYNLQVYCLDKKVVVVSTDDGYHRIKIPFDDLPEFFASINRVVAESRKR